MTATAKQPVRVRPAEPLLRWRWLMIPEPESRSGRRRLVFPAQIDERQFHCPLDWDTNDAFTLVDPTVGGEGCGILFALRFQFCFAIGGPFPLVIGSACHRANQGEHNETKHQKQQNDA